MNKQKNTVLNVLNFSSVKQLSKKEMKYVLGGASEKDSEEVGVESDEGEGEEEGME